MSAHEVRVELLALPLSERLARLFTAAGSFVCPHCHLEHPWLSGPPSPEGAPGSFACSCGESTVISTESDVASSNGPTRTRARKADTTTDSSAPAAEPAADNPEA